MNAQEKKRTLYLDILRIAACFFVIVVHVSSNQLSILPPQSMDYQVSNFFNTLSITAPAIFIMISGSIFLSPAYRNIPLKKLWGKYILRMVIAYIFWCCLYTLIFWIPYYSFSLETVKLYLLEVTTSRPIYHMWYVPMIISIYIVLPLLGPAFENKARCKYFLVLYIVIQLIIPTILKFTFPHKAVLQGIYSKIPFLLCVGHVGYFVLGHYLNTEDFGKRARRVIYALGILGLVTAVGIDASLSISQNTSVLFLDDIFSINIFLFAAAVFVAFRYIPWKAGRFSNFISGLSRLTFGIYLVHVLVMNQIFKSCAFLCELPAIIWIPAIAAITFLVSTAIIWIISRIPILNKYII